MKDHSAKAVTDALNSVSMERSEARRYLGASIVGQRCDAFLSFALRGFPEAEVAPRTSRIFALGHRIEDIVVADLRKAGLNILDRDPTTRRQFGFQAVGGHVRCNLDGIEELSDGQTRIVEIKSMNDEKWKDCKTKGVRYSHPSYWDQMQMMMGMSGIHSCLFVAYNKNNSEYLAQVVDFDEMDYAYIKERIRRVFDGEVRRVSDDPSKFTCRMCRRINSCWLGESVTPSCPTCEHSLPSASGGWRCQKHGRKADELCGDYKQFVAKDKL